MEPVKINRRKNKVFGCFKPNGPFDETPRCETRSLSSFSGVASGGRRKKSSHRSISGAVKAVLCITTSLAKKFQSENPKKVFQRSNSNLLSPKSLKPIKSMKRSLSFSDPITTPRDSTTSDSSSLLLSSSSSNSSLTCSSTLSPSYATSTSSTSSRRSQSSSTPIMKRSLSFDLTKINRQKSITKRDMEGGRGIVLRNPTVEMCVVLVCLVSLVFWGKAFAIVTATSTWLFFGPTAAVRRQLKGYESSTENDDQFESVGYKKKVVMEGILERSRPTLRPAMSFSLGHN